VLETNFRERKLRADPGWFGQYALPGLLGSLFMSVGALGVGWFPLSADILQWQLIDFVQTQTLGLALTRSFVVVGAALLLQAWLVVGIDALHDKISRLETIYFSFLAWCLPLLFAPPLFSRDVYSYYMQGQLQLTGNNPYESGVSVVPGWFQSGVDPLWGDAPTPYGPVFLLLEKLIAAISGDSAFVAAYIFRALALVGVLFICFGLPGLARAHGINPITAVWLGVMNPLVVMHFVAGAHNDALMVGIIFLALRFALSKHFIIAVVLATIALAIKPVAIVLLPFLALMAAGANSNSIRRARYALITGIVSLVVLFAISALAGTGPFGWVNSLSTPGAVKSWLSPTTAIGMLVGEAIKLFGFGNFVDTCVQISRLIGSVLLAGVLVLLVLRPDGRSGTRAIALSLVALVVLGPVVQPWYLLWSIPLLAATGLTHKQVRIMVLLIAAFTIHGIANSSATADTFLDLSDGIAMVLAGLTIGLAILASKTERSLILGDSAEKDLLPNNAHAIAVAKSMELT
jgi:alpha-1,6-mannosyltransferase